MDRRSSFKFLAASAAGVLSPSLILKATEQSYKSSLDHLSVFDGLNETSTVRFVKDWMKGKNSGIRSDKLILPRQPWSISTMGEWHQVQGWCKKLWNITADCAMKLLPIICGGFWIRDANPCVRKWPKFVVVHRMRFHSIAIHQNPLKPSFLV